MIPDEDPMLLTDTSQVNLCWEDITRAINLWLNQIMIPKVQTGQPTLWRDGENGPILGLTYNVFSPDEED